MNASRKSRYAVQLDAAVAAAGNPLERRCRQAERAALWARQGDMAAASQAIEALQGQAALQPLPLADGWLLWSEAVVSYYSNMARDAAALMESAHERAEALLRTQPAAQPLAAVTAAWLGSYVFTRDDPPRMAGLLRRAIELSDDQHHLARERAALGAAYAYLIAGRADLAQPWHSLSRRHGVTLGDEAHVSALMHNHAAMSVNAARMAHLFSDEAALQQSLANDMAQCLMMVESVDRFDDGIGSASLRSLVPMLQAQMVCAQGEWAQALALFDQHLPDAMEQGMATQAPTLHADMAWCAWQLGLHERSAQSAAWAQAALATPGDADDQALAWARLSQLARAQGQEGEALRCRQHAEAALKDHRAHQAAIGQALIAALQGIAPGGVAQNKAIDNLRR
jgi:hypothetical protein